MNSKSGTLFIVGTPIGNLADMTYRAVDVLRGVDLILAEDTRHARLLLRHYQIDQPLWSCHEHNERKQLPRVLARLQGGEQIALISDPGYPLVSEARRTGIPVSPIPGPCAVVAGLCAAGLPTDRFRFEGFIPSRPGPRKRFLESVLAQNGTAVMYESSHRIIDSVTDLGAIADADRRIVVGRELTKKFEQFYSGSPAEVLNEISASVYGARGEFVVMVEGATPDMQTDADAIRLLRLLIDEMPLKKASGIAAEYTGENRNRLYQLGLELQADQTGQE